MTFASRFHRPCPNEPRPMPMSLPLVFAIDGGSRTFADAGCTVDTKCP